MHVYIGPTDFTPTFQELTLRPPNERDCATIPITNDTLLESDEVFFVGLQSSSNDIIARQSSTTVTILDDDGKLLTFNNFNNDC